MADTTTTQSWTDSVLAEASAHGLTNAEIAEICGVSRVAVSQWRNGHASPKVCNLQPLADRLGMSLAAGD